MLAYMDMSLVQWRQMKFISKPNGEDVVTMVEIRLQYLVSEIVADLRDIHQFALWLIVGSPRRENMSDFHSWV